MIVGNFLLVLGALALIGLAVAAPTIIRLIDTFDDPQYDEGNMQ